MSKFSTDITIDHTLSVFDSSQDAAFDLTTTPKVTQGTGTTCGFFAAGNFENATITLQYKVGSTWVDAGEDTTLTESGGGLFTLPISELRVKVTGAGVGAAFPASLDVDVLIKPLNL